MNDLRLWQWLHEGGGSPGELAASLHELAKLPLKLRFPWFGRLDSALDHPDPGVRGAALEVLAGATGLSAFQRLVEALHDRSLSVRLIAVESLRISAAADPARWVHAIYHPDVKVRVAALAGNCVADSEPYLLPLLETADHALPAAEQLSGRRLERGELDVVIRPWRLLGLVLRVVPGYVFTRETLTADLPDQEGQISVQGGLMLIHVRPGSPSVAQKLHRGDVLVWMNGRETRSHEDVAAVLAESSLEPTRPIRFAVLRRKKTVCGQFSLPVILAHQSAGLGQTASNQLGGNSNASSFSLRRSRDTKGRVSQPKDNAIEEFLQQDGRKNESPTVFRVLRSRDFEELLILSRDNDQVVAAAAVARLVELKQDDLPSLKFSEESIALFLRQFLDNNSVRIETTRVAAARWLYNHGDTRGFPLILGEIIADQAQSSGFLKDADGLLVKNAVRAGLYAGPGAVPPEWLLERLLELPDRSLKGDCLAVFVVETADLGLCKRAMERLRLLRARSWKLNALADTFAWGKAVGFALTQKLFSIEMLVGEELGYTRLEQSRIHVNPLPLLRQEENGRDIVRGLILHELGHHKYHGGPVAKQVWERATAEKIFQLLNVVTDEHLERNLRAENRDHGHMLKRLCTYAFQHLHRDVPVQELIDALSPAAFETLVQTRLKAARKRGCVRVASGQVLRAAEQAGSSFARFLRALRMGLGTRGKDPKAVEALQLFTPEFRHSTMNDLLQIARKLREIFGNQVMLLDLVAQDKAMAGDASDLIVHGDGLSQSDVDNEIARRHPPLVLNQAAFDGDPVKSRVKRPSDGSVRQQLAQVRHDPVAQRVYAQSVALEARLLRQFLLRAGATRSLHPRRMRGSRLDGSRILALVLRGDPQVLMLQQSICKPDLFIGVLVDCSNEMNDTIELAKRFATVIAVAAKEIPGIDSRFFGYTHNTISEAGDAERPAIHGLGTRCCKNVTAALGHVADRALDSKRKNRLLVVIDAPETEGATLDALRKLTRLLSRKWRIHCAEVAMIPPNQQSYPHTIVLAEGQMAGSARQLGMICVRIAGS